MNDAILEDLGMPQRTSFLAPAVERTRSRRHA
jgi:hypothetical protein